MVYFIRAGDKIKIGFARSESAVRSRYATIRNASPMPVVLLGAMEGTVEDEHALHRRFQAYRAEGEWFAAEPAVLEVVAQAVEVTPAPGTRLSFRCSQDLVDLVDATRAREPREAWLRRAVETALRRADGPAVAEASAAIKAAFGSTWHDELDAERALETSGVETPGATDRDVPDVVPPAPAEQLGTLTALDKARAQRDQWAAASRTPK